MRDPTQAILNAIDRDEAGIAIIWCPDLGLRDWLVDEVESLVDEGARPIRVATVDAAFKEPERLVLLIPEDERAAVLDLDGSREHVIGEGGGRSQPIVLFLVYGGDGQRALAEAGASLSSWIKGTEADPDKLAQVDAAEERAQFERETGMTVKEWLDRWRNEQLPKIPDNYRLSYRAMLLEDS